MDQVKEFLKQAIKYRFWIAVGIAALMPVVAYSVASGSLKSEADAEAAKIKGAHESVKKYSSGLVPGRQFTEGVEAKTAAATEEVNAAWRKLYERQAPLLTWPEEVNDSFSSWGRKYPEKVAASSINETIQDYMRVYPDAVTKVYKSFDPWDSEEGTGIVAAPPEEILLNPAKFDPDALPLPGLGEIWAAQEKLWIQGVVLDVIDQINEKAKAKNWDTAVVKQINLLDVASPTAQDEQSISKGEQLVLADPIVDPNAPVEETTEEAPAEGGDSGRMMMESMGGMGMGMGGGPTAKPEDVYYVESPNKDQYRIVPIQLKVLLDQSRIPDLLIEFQNSPMNIQVREIEVQRPAERVKKPVKGEALDFAGYGGGGMGMMGMMGGRMGMMMGGERVMGGRMGMMGGDGMEGMMSSMMGGNPYGGMDGMMGAGPTAKKKGETYQKNVQGKVRGKDQDKSKKKDDRFAPKIGDPYFNIVELTIYGQARFYLPPPEEPAAESESATPDAAPADAEAKPAEPKAEEEGEAKAEQPKADAEPKAKDEASKTEEAAPTADAQPAKAEEPKAGDETPER